MSPCGAVVRVPDVLLIHSYKSACSLPEIKEHIASVFGIVSYVMSLEQMFWADVRINSMDQWEDCYNITL